MSSSQEGSSLSWPICLVADPEAWTFVDNIAMLYSSHRKVVTHKGKLAQVVAHYRPRMDT